MGIFVSGQPSWQRLAALLLLCCVLAGCSAHDGERGALPADSSPSLFAAVIKLPPHPSGADRETGKRFAALLAQELCAPAAAEGAGGAPEFRHVEYRAGQRAEAALRRIARTHPQAVLAAGDVEELRRRFDPAALAASLERLAAGLAALPENSPERARLLEDPLHLAGVAEKACAARMAARGAAAGSFFAASDGARLAVFARRVPARAGQDAPAAAEAARLRAAQRLGVPAPHVEFFVLPERELNAAELELKEMAAHYDMPVAELLPPADEQERALHALRNADYDALAGAFTAAVRARFGEKGPIFFKPFLRRLQDLRKTASRANILRAADVQEQETAGMK